MHSNTRDRLLISIAVIVAVMTLVGPFLISSLESWRWDVIYSSCKGEGNSSGVCFDKSGLENKLSVWLFFSPLVVPALAIWSKWVWQIPYPEHSSLFDHRAYRIIEALILLISVLISGSMLWDASRNKLILLDGSDLVRSLLFPVCFSGSILAISWLLNRAPASKMFYFARVSLVFALATPFLYIGITLARQWGS